ncbi:ABC transporter permease, partial [bacterium]|nr:ABC transporter permease [bacterium]
MNTTTIKNFLLKYGFMVVLLLIVAIYSLSASSFLTISNWLSMMHAFAPTLIMITG